MSGVEGTVAVLNQFGDWVSNSRKPHQLIYLFQITSFDLGFRHEWYGIPISRSIGEVLEEYDLNEADYKTKINGVKLTDAAGRGVVKTKRLIDSPEGIYLDKWLELLSSLHYFKNICYNGARTYEGISLNLTNTFLALDENRRHIMRQDHSRKFSLDDFKSAWSRLDDFGLLNKKHNRDN